MPAFYWLGFLAPIDAIYSRGVVLKYALKAL